MKKIIPLSIYCLLSACGQISQKTKEAVHKTGEVVAETGAEFADGVSSGIEKAYSNEIVLAEHLQKAGLSVGKMDISNTDSGEDNLLTVYVTFDKDFEGRLVAKVFDEKGQEYGRTGIKLNGKRDEGKYVDFVFDKRTHIEGKGKIVLE